MTETTSARHPRETAASRAPGADGALSASALAAQPAAPARRRPRTRGQVLAMMLLAIIALAVLAICAELTARAIAAHVISDRIEEHLPDRVTVSPQVRFHDTSIIWSYLANHGLDDVTIGLETLEIAGHPVKAELRLHGIDLADTENIGVAQVTGTIDITRDALVGLVSFPGADGVELGDGVIRYTSSASILGLGVEYVATAKPLALGQRIVFTPTSFELSGAGASAGVSFDELFTKRDLLAIPVCVADYLPSGVEVTQLDVTPGRATATLEGESVRLNENWLTSTGSCG